MIINIVDGSLDLNTLLIQICKIKSYWYLYGEALGVSPKTLDEVKEMELEDYDKLVEVLNAYFRTRSQDLPPTWKEIAEALRVIGYEKMAVNIISQVRMCDTYIHCTRLLILDFIESYCELT